MSDKQAYLFTPLTQYFHQINQPAKTKGLTMFSKYSEAFKAKWNEYFCKDVNNYLPKDEKPVETEDFWSFEIRTGSWDDCGEVVPTKHDFIFDNVGESTWMDTLDQILDVMNKHYGYNIKEQVYYSVKFPMNGTCPYTGKLLAGHGRNLNDGRLQLLLLAHPEVYESGEAE